MQTKRLKTNSLKVESTTRNRSFFFSLITSVMTGCSRFVTQKRRDERLEKLRLSNLSVIGADIAKAEARRFGWQFAWELKRSVDDIRRIELLSISAQLNARAGNLDNAIIMERDAEKGLQRFLRNQKKKTENVKETEEDKIEEQEKRYEIRRRLLYTRLTIARLLLDQGNHQKAIEYVERSVSSHVLNAEDWETVMDIISGCNEQNEYFFPVYIKYLAHCSGSQGKNVHRVDSMLQKMIQMPENAVDDQRELAIRRLRALQMAAPSMKWPAVLLAETDIQDNRLEQADTKLRSVYPYIAGELKTQAAFLRGQVEFYKENYSDADDYFDAAIVGGAEVSRVYEFVGLAKANLGKFGEAMDYIEKALEVNSDDLYLVLQLANILLCMNSTLEAEKLYKRILDIDKENKDARFGQAKIQEIRGNLSKAAEIYKEILADKSGHLEAQFSLGLILLEQGEREKGQTHLEKILSRYKKHLPTLLELGISMVQEAIVTPDRWGRLEKGIEYLTNCCNARYPDQRVLYWLGRGLAQKKEYAACLEHWSTLEDVLRQDSLFRQQINEVRYFQALDLAQHGDLEGAVRLLEQLTPEAPMIQKTRDLICLFQMMMAHNAVSEGQHEKAFRFVKNVLIKQPDNAHAHFLSVILRLKDEEVCEDELQSAINQMADGTVKNIFKLLCWFRNRRLSRDLPDEERLWDIISIGHLPTYIHQESMFKLFLFVYNSLIGTDNGWFFQDENLEELIELVEKNQNWSLFSTDEFGWWLAKNMLDGEIAIEFSERLDGQNLQENSPLHLAWGLINIGNKKKQAESISRIQRAITGESDDLKEYIGKALCHCSYQEILKIGKVPVSIHKAAEYLHQAQGLWR